MTVQLHGYPHGGTRTNVDAIIDVGANVEDTTFHANTSRSVGIIARRAQPPFTRLMAGTLSWYRQSPNSGTAILLKMVPAA